MCQHTFCSSTAGPLTPCPTDGHALPWTETPKEDDGNKSTTIQKQAAAPPALDVGSQYVS